MKQVSILAGAKIQLDGAEVQKGSRPENHFLLRVKVEEDDSVHMEGIIRVQGIHIHPKAKGQEVVTGSAKIKTVW